MKLTNGKKISNQEFLDLTMRELIAIFEEGGGKFMVVDNIAGGVKVIVTSGPVATVESIPKTQGIDA